MNNSTYIFACVILLVLGGCTNVLDTQPQQSISSDVALSTSENVKKTLVGAYNDMGDVDVYGGWMYVLPDLMAAGKEAQYTGTQPPPGEVYRKSITVSNAFIRDIWRDSYATINVANNVNSAIDVVEEGDRARVEGEAKFIRAVIYFQLVRLFAKDFNDGDPSQNMGVPLKLEPTRTIDESENIPRSSVQAVYDQIIKDLKAAKAKLGEQPPGYIYADTYAASAFLARVYLHQGRYELARDEANRVITEGPYSLVGEYSSAFNNSNVNTSEDIFATQVSNQDGENALHGSYASQSEGGGDAFSAITTQRHLDLYESGDDRLAFFYQDDNGNWHPGKWKNQYGNVNVIRLAEMYLIRAEANKRLNETVGAAPYQDINTLRNRAGLGDVSPPVSLQQILEERHLELAFEGHFLFDLKRTKGSVGGIPWDSPRLVFPIPQREMDANDKLEQNEGYGN